MPSHRSASRKNPSRGASIRNPSDLKPGLRVGKYRVEEVRKHDVVVSGEDDKGDGKEFYRVEATTLADLKRALKAKDEAYAQFRQFLNELDNPRRKNPSRGASVRDRRAAQQDILGLVFVPEKGPRGAAGGGLRRARALHREIGGYLVPYTGWQEGKGEVSGYLVGEEMEAFGYDEDYLASLAPTYDATRQAPRAAASRRKNPPQGFRIAGPAVKTMVDGLRISKADAQKLKDMMDTGAPRILEAADRMMDGYGVERIPGRPGLMIVNMGDAYLTTIIYDYKTNRFVVASWGDIVERQPRRFAD